jgi:hypothetical protein
MRLLAQKTDSVLATTQDWEQSPKLASLNGTDPAPARQDISAFRSALASIREDAAAQNQAQLTRHYAELMGSYRKLLADTGTDKTR